ncbi:MAG: hypothetical protein AAFU64_04190 [Bacteroidota bacterium]
MKYLLISALVIFLTPVSEDPLIGKWKLKSNTMIAQIKNSPAFLDAEPDMQARMNKIFNTFLKEGEYHFKKDTLVYTDLMGTSIVRRRATWKRDDKIIQIKEIDRPLEREAQIVYLNGDSLVISPIIQGVIGKSKISFVREGKD